MRIMIVLALAALTAGCASATRGWHETLTVTSTPSGAKAEIIVTNASKPAASSPSDQGSSVASDAPPPTESTEPFACTTPCAAKIARSHEITVRVSKEGYETEVVPLKREITGTGAAGFAGNVLLGGAVGMAVDAASGAALDHKPNPVIVTLRPIPPAARRPQRKGPPRRAPAAPATEAGPRVGM